MQLVGIQIYNIYKVYKDKLQNCSCNQFHYIGTYKQVEKNSMTKNRGGNDGSEKWIKKTLWLLVKKFCTLTEHPCSLPCSQQPTIRPCTQTDETSRCAPIYTCRNIVLQVLKGFQAVSCLQVSLYALLFSLVHAACPAHHILLDSFNRTISGQECKSVQVTKLTAM